MKTSFRLKHSVRSILGAAAVAALLVGCGGGGDSGTSSTPTDTTSAAAQLGAKIFLDTSLSASRNQSCASCHADSSGGAQENALTAQLGGPLGDLQGGRSSPMARYLDRNTDFFIGAEGTPTGGFFWDGRASSLADQAGGPFLNPVEMAMPNKASVVLRLSLAGYADEFRKVYGANVFDDVDSAYAKMTQAIAAFETENSKFHSYSSKYDAFLAGKATLSDQESRGLTLFNSPEKGNCAACHPSEVGADGKPPLFTDFTYDNLGVPRNTELQANADPTHFDLGLCQSANTLAKDKAEFCGAFKVPSLRNVALRQAYFHNGKFKTLKDALTFYVQRDTNPEKWYPAKADGSIDKFNDLPEIYKANVNTTEAPYNRTAGAAPALSDAEVDDVVAFLRTLSDGYTGAP
jgi:cytochrome c peroxidase